MHITKIVAYILGHGGPPAHPERQRSSAEKRLKTKVLGVLELHLTLWQLNVDRETETETARVIEVDLHVHSLYTPPTHSLTLSLLLTYSLSISASGTFCVSTLLSHSLFFFII